MTDVSKLYNSFAEDCYDNMTFCGTSYKVVAAVVRKYGNSKFHEALQKNTYFGDYKATNASLAIKTILKWIHIREISTISASVLADTLVIANYFNIVEYMLAAAKLWVEKVNNMFEITTCLNIDSEAAAKTYWGEQAAAIYQVLGNCKIVKSEKILVIKEGKYYSTLELLSLVKTVYYDTDAFNIIKKHLPNKMLALMRSIIENPSEKLLSMLVNGL